MFLYFGFGASIIFVSSLRVEHETYVHVKFAIGLSVSHL